MTKNPVIAATTGDPCGIGPEVITKAIVKAQGPFTPVLIGNRKILENAGLYALLEKNKFKNVVSPEEILDDINHPTFLHIEHPVEDLEPGKGSAMSGRVSGLYLDAALSLLDKKKADLLFTGPINKKHFISGGYNYNGHTDYLQKKTGSELAYMMFAGHGQKLLLHTHHLPLRKVPRSIKKETILKTLEFIHKKGPFYGLYPKKIGIMGLNPHAGEEGELGTEELEEIIPAVLAARGWGLPVEGPLPADALFRPEVRKKYDFLIAMYHDQGLTGFKALGSSVNVSIGLPFIRVSVDHGTAYDIAGAGKAKIQSGLDAIDVGYDLWSKRKVND